MKKNVIAIIGVFVAAIITSPIVIYGIKLALKDKIQLINTGTNDIISGYFFIAGILAIYLCAMAAIKWVGSDKLHLSKSQSSIVLISQLAILIFSGLFSLSGFIKKISFMNTATTTPLLIPFKKSIFLIGKNFIFTVVMLHIIVVLFLFFMRKKRGEIGEQ